MEKLKKMKILTVTKNQNILIWTIFVTDNTVQLRISNSGNLSNKIFFGDSEVDAYAKFRETGMFEHE